MKTRFLLLFVLVSLLVVGCQSGGDEEPSAQVASAETALASAQATIAAQVTKIDSLTDVITDLQAAKPGDASELAQATIAALSAERDGAKMVAADSVATAVACATLEAEARAEIARSQGLPSTPGATQPTAEVGPTLPTAVEVAAGLLRDAATLAEAEAWGAALAKLEALAAMDDVIYDAEIATKLAYEVHYNLGLAAVEGSDIEGAAAHFDAALEANPDDPDVLKVKRLASLYLTGFKAEAKEDWAEAVNRYATLFSEVGGYVDVGVRLPSVRMAFGDALGAEEKWCEARDQYQAALAMVDTAQAVAKLADAEEKCTAASQPGRYVGQMLEPEDITKLTTNWTAVRGHVRNRAGQPMVGVTAKLSAYDWSATATTDGSGRYAFDFLDKELKFVVELLDLPSLAVEVETKFGFAAQVDFVESP
jgi:tetratricopeptide (TPR) repeat protein